MEPLEIKIALMRAGISQTEIARRAGVSCAQVHRVIGGEVSHNVRSTIAQAINRSVDEIWPDYYLGMQRAANA